MTTDTFKKLWIFVFVAAAVLTIQMIAIRRPYAGHFASYQGTVMASIARNMARKNFSEILYPKTEVLIGGKRSLHLNQYPFPSLIAAAGWRAFGGTLEFWGRFEAIFFNLLSILLLALIAAKIFDPLTGWIAACLYALSPYTLIYGQSFMSESCALFLMLSALALLILRKGESLGWVRLILSGIAFSMTVTGRIHWIVFYPVFGFVMAGSKPEGRLKKFFIFIMVSALMPLAWYAHTYFASRDADNVMTNLFMQTLAAKPHAANPLLNLDYYQKVFDILAGTMMTPLLFPFLLLGLIVADKKQWGFRYVLAGLCGGILILILAPAKVLKHDFYLYAAYPFCAMMAACGMAALVRALPVLRSLRIAVLFLLGYLIVSARYFFHPIFKYSETEAKMVHAAAIVREKTLPHDRLIVFGDSAPIVIYYADRAAWPIQPALIGRKLERIERAVEAAKNDSRGFQQLEESRRNVLDWFQYLYRQGATYFVGAKNELAAYPEFRDYLLANFHLMSTTDDDFYLFQLSYPSSGSAMRKQDLT